MKRYITEADGKKYDLPDVEYDFHGSDRPNVLNLAMEPASATGKAFRVLVTESAGRTWYGLDEI